MADVQAAVQSDMVIDLFSCHGARTVQSKYLGDLVDIVLELISFKCSDGDGNLTSRFVGWRRLWQVILMRGRG